MYFIWWEETEKPENLRGSYFSFSFSCKPDSDVSAGMFRRDIKGLKCKKPAADKTMRDSLHKRLSEAELLQRLPTETSPTLADGLT